MLPSRHYLGRIRMSIKSTLSMLRKPTPNELARESYGPEPYRAASEVSVNERVAAVLQGRAKFLLREVIGLSELKKLPEGLIAQRFRRELPVTADQVFRYIESQGLPKGFDDWGIRLTESAGAWHLTEVDIRGPSPPVPFSTKHEAELAVLLLRRHTIEPFVSGTLDGARQTSDRSWPEPA